LLTILAFRGGALAKAGHNHVIASHDVTGTFYVPADALRSTFELHVPVAQLTIDEPQLRAQEGSDFRTDVPESAKEGTRRNMLSEALLNGAQFPEITLVSKGIAPATEAPVQIPGNAALPPPQLQAETQLTVRGQLHTIVVPVRYELNEGRLVASGELAIKQSDLGLTPFSAMLGALQVQDEMRVRFRLIAHEAKIN
jgi:polyisoprenoid-binding protein YceI